MVYQKRLPQQRSLVVGAGVLADRPVQGKSDNREQRNEPMIASNAAKRVRAKSQQMSFRITLFWRTAAIFLMK